MNNKELLKKISHNKILLFFIPNLIYILSFLNFYNSNMPAGLEVLFSEVILISLVFFILSFFIYLFLMKALKNPQKVFFIQCLVSLIYFVPVDLISFLLLVVCGLVLVISFKKFINFNLDNGVCLISFFVVILFCFNFVSSIYNALNMVIFSRDYDVSSDVVVLGDTDMPNIYYIHCDGMMGISGMSKYFNYDNLYLKNYFDKNGYYLQEDASLVAGHNTQRSLVALFNPNYYDEFYGDYVNDLEDFYLKKKKKTDFVVDYYELESKRFNNELFSALDKKGYNTYAIGEFNAYTSFDVDYYYDFYYYDIVNRYVDTDDSLRLVEGNSDFRLLSYTRFVHSKSLVSRTILDGLLSDVNFLDYDDVDYSDYDVSGRKYISRVLNDDDFEIPTAILRGLDDVVSGDNNFSFVDFRFCHEPFTFDYNGDIVSDVLMFNLDRYLGNYIYSSYLLTDVLDFIRDNDEDAVIIVQGDHGLHTRTDAEMMEYFDVDIKGVQEIRNSVISAMYIPDKYKNDDDKYLSNPLNISRYLVNNFVGSGNYEYLS